ncbi:acyl-CoA dehydrogenase family protein [Pseudonocardia acaciae]|uniref:acyl-CoA dehydrogenase family protein n=1 Tax=Pseudonocardia acaciae TaxID=551276 RepID=UPI00048C97A7|nr:acyl-CoA dehydrogenase family protein [Pseudonocardia acaciae]
MDEIEDAVAGALGGTGVTYSATNSDSVRCWDRLVESGLTTVGVPERHGGSGGGVDDLVAVAVAIGRSGASFPLLETQVANRLLASIGEPVQQRGASVLLPCSSVSASVRAKVLFGEWTGRWVRGADRSVAVYRRGCDWFAVPVKVAPTVEPEVLDNAGEPMTAVHQLISANGAEPSRLSSDDVARVRATLALGYLAQAFGAASVATEMALSYASVRRQFGRAISAFQRVQDHLCVCVEELLLVKALLAGAVSARGVDVGGTAHAGVAGPACIARIFQASHQVHGAIGYTREHGLHRFTLRSLAWSDACRTVLADLDREASPDAIT